MSVPLSDTRLTFRDEILAALSAAGAFCGECGFQPGETGCADCLRVRGLYADAVMPIVDRLRKQNRDLGRSLDEVIGERDYAQSMADKLAAAIAPADVLGEHSDGNFPWQNALDWAAEKERGFEALRKELADTAMMRDFYQRSADHIATNRAVAEAAIAKWERGDLASYDALQAIKQAFVVSPASAPTV